MRPDRSIPLPFFSDIGIGLVDKFAQLDEHLATPVSKFRIFVCRYVQLDSLLTLSFRDTSYIEHDISITKALGARATFRQLKQDL